MIDAAEEGRNRRHSWGGWWDDRHRDLRHAARRLLRAPAFTAVAITTLALGIGATTAIVGVVDSVLLRRPPLASFDRLVMVWETDRHTHTIREPGSVPDYLDYRARSRRLDGLAALLATEVNLAPPAGDPVRLAAVASSHDLLPLIGITPSAGRWFTADEDRPGGPKVAIISASLGERLFPGEREVLGKSLRLDEVVHVVVGVVGDEADFGLLQVLGAAAYSRGFADRGDRRRVDVWTPLQPDPGTTPRDTHPIFMIGRLGEGSGRQSAQVELSAIAADLERAYPSNEARGVFVEPLAEVVFGPVRPAFALLLAAGALVLLVACANVANLLLARGSARASELATRAALGAGRGRLAAELVTESLVLTVCAAAAGAGLAAGLLRLLVSIAPPDVPRLESAAIGFGTLAVTAVASVVIGVAFGLVPLMQAGGSGPGSALRASGGGRAVGSRGANRLRGALVVAEVAVSAVLVVGAGLLVRSLDRLLRVDAGFTARGVTKAEFQLPASRYPADFSRWPDFEEMHAFTRALLDRVAALPGVGTAAVAGNHPLDPGFTNSFAVVGRETESRDWPEISVRRVTPGYFATVGLPLVAGRLIEEADGTAAPPVLLINAEARRRFFSGRDPVGAQIQLWGAARTIVGVVADERFQGLAAPPPPAVYTPLAQTPSANGAGVLLARGRAGADVAAADLRVAVRQVDPALAVFGIERLDETIAASVGRRRFTMSLLILFALVAVVLGAVGVHGVLGLAVAERRREIGLRMALGAAPGQVLGLVAGGGMRLVGAGLAVGLAAAFLLTRLMRGLLFGVSAADPAAFAGAVVLLGLASLGSAVAPARRATKIDPVAALRAE